MIHVYITYCYSVVYFKDTAPTETYTYLHALSLHYSLPISLVLRVSGQFSLNVEPITRSRADPDTHRHLLDAAREERDHLRWCEERLQELDDGQIGRAHV